MFLMLLYLLYKKYKYKYDKFIISNIPILSKLIQSYLFFRLFLSISIIVKSKYKLQIALEHSKTIIENLYIQEIMNEIIIKIENGNSISKAFKYSYLFDDLTIRLLYTAQETNNYEQILIDLTLYYKQRLQKSIKLFSSILEPAIIFLISLIVLWLILAVMMPIWNLSSIIS